MIRRVIAAVLLAAIGCGFYFWSHTKNDTIHSLNAMLDTLSVEIDQSNVQGAMTTVENIRQFYTDRQDIFYFTTNHEFINDLSDYVSEIEVGLKHNDISRTETAIAYLRNHINDFLNDNKISLTNII